MKKWIITKMLIYDGAKNKIILGNKSLLRISGILHMSGTAKFVTSASCIKQTLFYGYPKDHLKHIFPIAAHIQSRDMDMDGASVKERIRSLQGDSESEMSKMCVVSSKISVIY